MMRWLTFVLLAACARETRDVAPQVLWFGGDVHLGRQGHQALSTLELDGPLVVNLEGPIGETVEDSTAQRLVNPPDTARLLVRAGVRAVGVDNNHRLDAGDAGLRRTVALLEREGLVALGSGQLGGVRLLQVDLSGGMPEGLAQRLERARPTVLLLHVLAPPSLLPEPTLVAAVDLAVTAKIPAILSHGSHAVARVERRGASVIAWGLGNLAFDCPCTGEEDGLLVRLELAGGQVHRARAVPVRAGLNGRAASPPQDPALELDLLESLGSRLVNRTRTAAEW